MTRVFLDEQRTVKETEADLVGCRSGNCELLFRDNARRAYREGFSSSPGEDWEWLIPWKVFADPLPRPLGALPRGLN